MIQLPKADLTDRQHRKQIGIVRAQCQGTAKCIHRTRLVMRNAGQPCRIGLLCLGKITGQARCSGRITPCQFALRADIGIIQWKPGDLAHACLCQPRMGIGIVGIQIDGMLIGFYGLPGAENIGLHRQSVTTQHRGVSLDVAAGRTVVLLWPGASIGLQGFCQRRHNVILQRKQLALYPLVML